MFGIFNCSTLEFPKHSESAFSFLIHIKSNNINFLAMNRIIA